MTHSTSDDAPTVALLLTCLARRAIRRAGLRRVFACQTATKRYHTWHAASSWGCRYQRNEAMTHCTPDDTLLPQHCSSPASHDVQSAEPASTEYLPVRQPPNVTTPGTQRRHRAAGISEMELAHTPPSNNTRSITTKPGSHPRTTAAAQGSALTCLARHTDCGPSLRRVVACDPGANHQYLSGCTSSSILTKPGPHSKASRVSSRRFPCLTCRALCAAAHTRVRLVLACPSTDTRAYSQDTATPP